MEVFTSVSNAIVQSLWAHSLAKDWRWTEVQVGIFVETELNMIDPERGKKWNSTWETEFRVFIILVYIVEDRLVYMDYAWDLEPEYSQIC